MKWQDKDWKIGNFVGRRCVVILDNEFEFLGDIIKYRNGLVHFNDDAEGELRFHIRSIVLISLEKDYTKQVNKTKQEITVRSI